MENEDRNTKYFHNHSAARKKHIGIEGLKFNNGERCYDENQLKDEAVRFFQELYSMDGANFDRLPNYGYFEE